MFSTTLVLCLLFGFQGSPANRSGILWRFETFVSLNSTQTYQVALIEITNVDQVQHEYEIVIDGAGPTNRYSRNAAAALHGVGTKGVIGPGRTETVPLRIPPRIRMSLSDCNFYVDGERVRDPSVVTYQSWFQTSADDEDLLVLEGESLEGALSKELDSHSANEILSRLQTTPFRVLSEKNSMDYAPQLLSGVDFILLTSSEYEALPKTLRNAVDDWVLSGGRLYTFEEKEVTGSPEIMTSGFGFHTRVPGSFKTSYKQWVKDDDLDFWYRYRALAREYLFQTTASVFPYKNTFPIRGFVLSMILTSLLLGPLNYWFLKRRKKLILLYLTVPGIAITAVVLLFLYSLFLSGLDTKIESWSLTYLDQAQEKAAVRSYNQILAPLSGKGTLTFSSDTAVFPFVSKVSDTYGRLDWSQGQVWHGGWVRPDIPFSFSTRELKQKKEKIHLEKGSENGAPRIRNLVGTTLRDFLYCDETGQAYEAATAEPGATVELNPTTRITCKTDGDFFGQLESDMVDAIRSSQTLDKPSNLPKAHFIATLDENPFADAFYKDNAVRSGTHFLIGNLEVSSDR